MIHVASWCSVLCLTTFAVQINGQLVRETIRINPKTLLGGDGQCPSLEEREQVQNEIRQNVASVISSEVLVVQPTDQSTAAPTSDPTYTCNGTPGWRRVAFINMTDTSYNCPTGLSLTSHTKRTCGRSNTARGCSSTTFNVSGAQDSQVCGMIRGYQFGATSAFYGSSTDHNQGIDGFYVDGVSLTHGNAGARQHIWTFASGLSEVGDHQFIGHFCPCDTSLSQAFPSFVGSDYFCESGLQTEWIFPSPQFIFYPDDVLWDGQNCRITSTCCEFNRPPWFTKNLPNPTTDDIELRICSQNTDSVDDVPLELIELYIQ